MIVTIIVKIILNVKKIKNKLIMIVFVNILIIIIHLKVKHIVIFAKIQYQENVEKNINLKNANVI
jgi:hypothetical protein